MKSSFTFWVLSIATEYMQIICNFYEVSLIRKLNGRRLRYHKEHYIKIEYVILLFHYIDDPLARNIGENHRL